MFIKPRLEQALGDLTVAYFKNIELLPEAVRSSSYDAGVEILKQLEEHEQSSTYGFLLWAKVGVLTRSQEGRSETFRIKSEKIYPLLGNTRLQSYAADAPVDLLYDHSYFGGGGYSGGKRRSSVMTKVANSAEWIPLYEYPVASFKKKMSPMEQVMLTSEVTIEKTTFLVALHRRHDLAFRYSFLNGSAAADFKRFATSAEGGS